MNGGGGGGGGGVKYTGGGKQTMTKLTAEAACQFQSGIELTLSRWPALQMAIENQWGGPHSHLRSQQILVDIYNLFTQSKERIYIDDVENLLDDAMLSLNVELDDGSVEEIAEKLMFMHEDCLEGNFSSIETLRTTSNQRGALPNITQVMDNSDDDSDDIIDDKADFDESSDMAVDMVPPQSTSNSSKETTVSESKVEPNMEAEDGWTVVATKRGKGRKK